MYVNVVKNEAHHLQGSGFIKNHWYLMSDALPAPKSGKLHAESTAPATIEPKEQTADPQSPTRTGAGAKANGRNVTRKPSWYTPKRTAYRIELCSASSATEVASRLLLN